MSGMLIIWKGLKMLPIKIITELEKLGELAKAEFIALEKNRDGISKKEIKRKVIRDFKSSIKNYFYLREFEKNKHKSKKNKDKCIMTYVPTIDEKGNRYDADGYRCDIHGKRLLDNNNNFIECLKMRKKKKTRLLSKKGIRRADELTTKYTRLFKQALGGDIIDFNHEIATRDAEYHLNRYNVLVELNSPTKTELIRAFKTWINNLIEPVYSNRTERAKQVISRFRLFDIPNLLESDITCKHKELQPTQLKYRTFEI